MVAVRCDVVRCQGLEISHIQHIHTQVTHTEHTYDTHIHKTHTRVRSNGKNKRSKTEQAETIFRSNGKTYTKPRLEIFRRTLDSALTAHNGLGGTPRSAERWSVLSNPPCPYIRHSLVDKRETEAPQTQENSRGGAVGMPLGTTARPSASARSVTVHESLRDDDSGVIFLSFSYLSHPITLWCGVTWCIVKGLKSPSVAICYTRYRTLLTSRPIYAIISA